MRSLLSIPPLVLTFTCAVPAGDSTLEACAEADSQCMQRNYDRVCAAHSANGDECLALASATEDRTERLRILRRVVEVSPSTFTLRLLAFELSQAGRREDTLEAGQLMERAFALSGHEWWYAARSAYFLYLEADQPGLAARLREKARKYLPAKPIKRAPANMTADEIHETLEQLCSHHALPVVGPGHCLDSIDMVVRHLAAATQNEHSQDIADVVAFAMVAATAEQDTMDREAPHWRDRYQAWIDSLVGSGLDSVAVRRLRAHAEEDSWPIIVE